MYRKKEGIEDGSSGRGGKDASDDIAGEGKVKVGT